MSSSFNRMIIIGRLGQDPEMKRGANTEVARFSLCNSQTINGQEEVQWHRICAFGRQAQTCKEFLRKGDLCCVEGRLQARKYEKNGENRVFNTIVADRVVFLTHRRRQGTQTPKSESDELEMAFPS